MKALWLTALGVCTVSVGLAETPSSTPGGSVPKSHSTPNTCLLESGCLGMSKIPLKACRIGTHGASARDACAFDGMKLVGKFNLTPFEVL